MVVTCFFSIYTPPAKNFSENFSEFSKIFQGGPWHFSLCVPSCPPPACHELAPDTTPAQKILSNPAAKKYHGVVNVGMGSMELIWIANTRQYYRPFSRLLRAHIPNTPWQHAQYPHNMTLGSILRDFQAWPAMFVCPDINASYGNIHGMCTVSIHLFGFRTCCWSGITHGLLRIRYARPEHNAWETLLPNPGNAQHAKIYHEYYLF